MQFKDILYEVKDDYAHVIINRPKVLNAFTPVTLQELKTALDTAEKDKEVGVIILSGSGDRAFCSGGDMNWESTKEFQDHEYEFHIHLTKCSKPIIAKVDGYAIGGGNHMAYFCDLTIASENSIFGQNGPRVGSPAGGAIVAHSANILGHKRAREMWMTCKRYSAKEIQKVTKLEPLLRF